MDVTPQQLLDFVLWYIIFLLSIVFHEGAHAWAARKMGDDTAYREGLVTLNPIPHIKRSLVGALIVPIVTFFWWGWMFGAASTPYNYEWAYTYPKKSAAMSAAGPVANLILVILAALFIHLGIYLGVFYAPETISYSSIVVSYDAGFVAIIAKLVSIMFLLNLVLFIFNLFPLPPLDGSGILPLYLNEETGRKYMNAISSPALSIIGFLIAINVFDVIFSKLFTVVLNLLYPGINYQ